MNRAHLHCQNRVNRSWRQDGDEVPRIGTVVEVDPHERLLGRRTDLELRDGPRAILLLVASGFPRVHTTALVMPTQPNTVALAQTQFPTAFGHLTNLRHQVFGLGARDVVVAHYQGYPTAAGRVRSARTRQVPNTPDVGIALNTNVRFVVVARILRAWSSAGARMLTIRYRTDRKLRAGNIRDRPEEYTVYQRYEMPAMTENRV